MFVSTYSDEGGGGKASDKGDSLGSKYEYGVALYSQDLNRKDYFERFSKFAAHEVDHLLNAGFADDGDFGEIYSGYDSNGFRNDPTKETVVISGSKTEEWSLVADGWRPEFKEEPMNNEYMAFSIEELVTIDTDDISSKEEHE